jgi:hypothetical protein
LVKSTRIRWVLEIIRGGETGSTEPQLSGGQNLKTRVKGLSDYYSNEIAVKAARQEASGPDKRVTLTE